MDYTTRHPERDVGQRSIFSRPLLLAWCLWLLASWAINRMIDATGFMEPTSTLPVVRGMLQSLLLGMGLIWPCWRLSQRRHARVGAETAADLVLLLLVAQIFVWPLRIVLGWQVAQAALVIATITVTGGAIGMIVWWGRLATGAGARALAMAACAVVLAGGWLWTWVTGEALSSDFSPMATVWTWADPDLDVGSADLLAGRLAWFAAGLAVLWAATLTVRLARRGGSGGAEAGGASDDRGAPIL